MKKLLLTVFISMFLTSAGLCAEKLKADVLPNESYLVLLGAPASVSMVSDTRVLKSEVLTTLYNERNQILLNTLKNGIARLYIAFDKDIVIIEFNADEANADKELNLESKLVKAIFKVDTLDKSILEELPFELDEPPALRGEH